MARILRKVGETDVWETYNTPMRSEEGCGIFSMVFLSPLNGIIVGGCYLDSTNTNGNCAVSSDGGQTWQPITEKPPLGYRSCVAYSKKSNLLVCCGRTGMEYSIDEGHSWISLTNQGYYTCALADSTGWAMGKRGKIAKLRW